MLQRDIFIENIRKKMKKNKNIYFLSADFGAVALDKLRKEFPDRFVHCGISEQAMVDMATGLALNNKTVFVYAMAPFLSLRAIEQIKCGPGLMKLPINILSVGIGLGYADSGPTHYATEDFACIRTVVGCSVYTLSGPEQSNALADYVVQKPHFTYIRFDRHETANIKKNTSKNDIAKGFTVHGSPSDNKVLLISQGKVSHVALEACKLNSKNFYFIDLIRSKPVPKELKKFLIRNKGIITIDEQYIDGGLGSCIFEFCSKESIYRKIKSICLPNEYIYLNGGRDYLLKKYKFSYKGILEKYNQLIKR
tara:strand:+ start:1704 stop:2627 length:924 start_codon:yes stop_codon:yes gene_type:complete